MTMHYYYAHPNRPNGSLFMRGRLIDWRPSKARRLPFGAPCFLLLGGLECAKASQGDRQTSAAKTMDCIVAPGGYMCGGLQAWPLDQSIDRLNSERWARASRPSPDARHTKRMHGGHITHTDRPLTHARLKKERKEGKGKREQATAIDTCM
jgi:hypothetical protein